MAPQVVKLLQRYNKEVFSCGLSEILNFSIEFSLELMICQGQKHRGKGIDGLIWNTGDWKSFGTAVQEYTFNKEKNIWGLEKS